MKKYAEISWCAGDVQTMAPRLTRREAEAWLAANYKLIVSATIGAGWQSIENILREDGIDLTDTEDDEPVGYGGTT